MNKYRITYAGENGAYIYAAEKDFKTLVEIQDIIYEKGCVVIGTTLYMAKCLIKIEQV